MRSSPQIEAILFQILTHGLLQARAAGWSGDAARAAVEVDHIHNLPRLLEEFDLEGLLYYWEAERPSYLDRVEPESAAIFEPLWNQLRPLILPKSAVVPLG